LLAFGDSHRQRFARPNLQQLLHVTTYSPKFSRNATVCHNRESGWCEAPSISSIKARGKAR
jgi:hypothetical protein